MIAEMHTVALTVTPVTASLTVAGAHPFAMAVRIIALFPDIHEIVVIDIALVKVRADARTGGNGTIGHDRSYGDACLTMEEGVANVALIIAQKALTAVSSIYLPALASLANEVEKSTELIARQLQLRVGSSTANRENGVEPPGRHAFGHKEIAYLRQGRIVALMNTGHHVARHLRHAHQSIDGITHMGKTVLVAPKPVVVGFHTVKTYGKTMEPGFTTQPSQQVGSEQLAVGHHTPREAPLIDAATTLNNIRTKQRLTASNDDKNLVWISLLGNAVENPEEIFTRHIAHARQLLTVAATMTARHITAQRALPEQLPQRVSLLNVAAHHPMQFQTNPLP